MLSFFFNLLEYRRGIWTQHNSYLIWLSWRKVIRVQNFIDRWPETIMGAQCRAWCQGAWLSQNQYTFIMQKFRMLILHELMVLGYSMLICSFWSRHGPWQISHRERWERKAHKTTIRHKNTWSHSHKCNGWGTPRTLWRLGELIHWKCANAMDDILSHGFLCFF